MKPCRYLFLLVMILTLAMGCGDDPKPAAPPGAKKTAKQDKKAAPGATQNKQEPKDPKAAAAGPEDGAQPSSQPTGEQVEPVAPSAERGEQAPDTTPEAAAPATAQPKAEEPPAAISRALTQVSLHGGLASIDVILQKVGAILPENLRGLMNAAVLGAGMADLAEKLGLKNMGWLDTSRSIRIAVKSRDSVVLVVPITSEQALLESLSPEVAATVVEKDGLKRFNNKAWFEVMGNEVFVSDKEQNLDALEGALRLELTRLTLDGLLLLKMSSESFLPLFNSALDELEQNLEQIAPLAPAQKELFAKLFSFVKDILADLAEIELRVDIVGKDLSVKYSFTAKPGSKLAFAVEEIGNGTIQTLASMPAKSWLILGEKLPTKAFLPWLDRYIEMIAAAYSLSEEDKLVLSKDYRTLLELFTGDASVAFYADSGFPIALSSVVIVKDGPKTMELVYKLYDYFFQKATEGLPPDARAMFAGRSMSDLINQMSPVAKTFGINLELSTEAYGGGTIDYLRVGLDYNVLNLPPNKLWLKDLLTDKLEVAIGASEDRFALTFGPNGLVRMKEIFDGTVHMDPLALFGQDLNMGKYNMVGNLRPMPLVNALMVIPDFANQMKASMAAEMEMLLGHNGLFLFAGIDEGATWWVDLRLDLDKLMPLISYKFQNMMKPAADLKTAPGELPPGR